MQDHDVAIESGPAGVRVVCSGSIDSDRAIALARQQLADPRVRDADRVTVSWRALEFISSLGIKVFATWIADAVDRPAFRVRFEIAAAQPWQRRTLAALMGVAGDALVVEPG